MKTRAFLTSVFCVFCVFIAISLLSTKTASPSGECNAGAHLFVSFEMIAIAALFAAKLMSDGDVAQALEHARSRSAPRRAAVGRRITAGSAEGAIEAVQSAATSVLLRIVETSLGASGAGQIVVRRRDEAA